MRILFTGGGTGGHFYPIVSIAEELNKLSKEKKLFNLELYYMAPTPYNSGILFENNITYKKNAAGKLRLKGSIKNFFDLFKTFWGTLISLVEIYRLYPDVVFGKGGYASFPALLAAKILHIPVVIHESDTVPGRVNLWASKFAQRIAISYKEAAAHFPAEKVAYTGQPIRKSIAMALSQGAREFLQVDEDLPVVLIMGGSQGAQKINETIMEALHKLLETHIVIHQTGANNYAEIKATADAILFDSPYKNRYRPFDYMNSLTLRMAAGIATVAVSRAGSTIFEIASWGVPAIIIPISENISRDQRSNAFAFARAGGCVVIEEKNLRPNILISEIQRLSTDQEAREKMIEADKNFHKSDSARLIAEEVLKIALAHEIK